MDLRAVAEYAYKQVLPWVAPPVIGAVIGYVTNDIAIRMLFWPLKEWRVFGLHVPFTPGIIPKRRFQMAESIGRMVSGELLTVEAVRRQMATEGFQERLTSNIVALLARLLDTPLAALRKGIQADILAAAERFLTDALHSFFSSRSFIHGVRTLMAQGVRHLSGLKLGEVLGSSRVGPILTDRILPLLGAPDSRRRIAGSVRKWLEERRADGEALGRLVPAELTQALAGLAGGLLPSLLEAALSWLEREETRGELQTRGKMLLRDVLDKLNLLQKFLLTAAQFDRRLEEKMPEIVNDALSSLRDYAFKDKTLDELRRVVQEALERWRQKPAAEALGGLRPEAVAELVERGLAGLQGEELRRRLARGVEGWLERQKERTLGELLQRVLHLPEQELVEFASTRLLGYLSRREASQAIVAEVVGFSRLFLEEHEGETLRRLLRLDESFDARASLFLARQLVRIIDERLPALIESFDVKQMVVEKVNNLDVAQMEQLLLMVIAKELKWVVLFGGILGAVIGLAQLLLRLVS
jgi:uncharacterized membrane protein YheB (UPF0754 family)